MSNEHDGWATEARRTLGGRLEPTVEAAKRTLKAHGVDGTALGALGNNVRLIRALAEVDAKPAQAPFDSAAAAATLYPKTHVPVPPDA